MAYGFSTLQTDTNGVLFFYLVDVIRAITNFTRHLEILGCTKMEKVTY